MPLLSQINRTLFLKIKNHPHRESNVYGYNHNYIVTVTSPFWDNDLTFAIKSFGSNLSIKIELDPNDFPPVEFGKIKIGEVFAAGSINLSTNMILIDLELKSLNGPLYIKRGDYIHLLALLPKMINKLITYQDDDQQQ